MHYRVFSGPRGSEDISSITKRNMLYKEFDALDSALLGVAEGLRAGIALAD